MDFELELKLTLDEPSDLDTLARRAAKELGISVSLLPPLEIKKKSIDARHQQVCFLMTVGPKNQTEKISASTFFLKKTNANHPVLIIGAGPAGIFCAYELARQGIASIILDRGKKVQARRRDLKGLTQHGVVDPDSNYCFGEGGAGTYSDGKLYTRAHKRGDIHDILETLVAHGAPESILVDARPHIGSNQLPKVITALREHLESIGVVFEFGARVTNILLDKKRAVGVKLLDNREILGQAIVVATGHSARDMISILDNLGAELESKPFAMGVRIEHPQPLINQIQYGRFAKHPELPAASYQLAYTPADKIGTFSFCMCPGGWIVPASTEPDCLVVNGMSLSRRDSPYANSGLVVSIAAQRTALGGLELQRRLEQAAGIAGGGALCAPAVRATDFVAQKISSTLPNTSYQPGLQSADLYAILGTTGLDIAPRLRLAILKFNQKMPGYLSEEAVLVGVESRTSSPVRVLRDKNTLMSPSLQNLYPCGEGACYAGGIMSAAMDGIQVARKIGIPA